MIGLALILGALPAPKFEATYADILKRVSAGETVVVVAGERPSHTPGNAVTIDRFPNEPDGVYRCFPGPDGNPVYLPVRPPVAAPIYTAAPAVVRLSRTAFYSTCPTCK